MQMLFKSLVVFAIILFAIDSRISKGHSSIGESTYYSNNYSYQEPIIKVYAINDDIISESKRIDAYESISYNANFDNLSTTSEV